MSAFRMVRFVGVTLGVFLLGYLVGAFMAWEWSPGEWDDSARALGGFLFAALGLGAAAVIELESRP